MNLAFHLWSPTNDYMVIYTPFFQVFSTSFILKSYPASVCQRSLLLSRQRQGNIFFFTLLFFSRLSTYFYLIICSLISHLSVFFYLSSFCCSFAYEAFHILLNLYIIVRCKALRYVRWWYDNILHSLILSSHSLWKLITFYLLKRFFQFFYFEKVHCFKK